MTQRDRRELKELAQLTALVRAQAEGKLARLRQQEAALRAQRAALASTSAQAFDPLLAVDRQAVMQAGVNWQSWVESRSRSLLAQESRVRAEIHSLTPDVALAVGRDDAVNRLRQDLLAQASQKANRQD
ncbi:hypothetical protein BVG79_02073 [Ketogulonicigenium robustum]|uniref:Uncharacterized protein n=1 Tax=Ketogulonicigenium robustum TaxID=92947 RepID=A0A1W6P1W7_9RHOB|nr:hypothetical protein [Ketogulonicigenium robustum]ARO15413.1 hypothetical protein BVG79_02073 [Ketogulonicigenium robustum]